MRSVLSNIHGDSTPRVGIVGSGEGSVFAEAFRESEFVRESIKIIMSDRECGLVSFAKENGIDYVIVKSGSNIEKSDEFLRILQRSECDIVISFYTRLFEGKILSEFSDRLLNFHPSILPSHPGLRGFEETIECGDTYMGATVHIIDHSIDGGATILQTILPNDTRLTINKRRHLVYKTQVSQLIYLLENWEDIRGVNFSK